MIYPTDLNIPMAELIVEAFVIGIIVSVVFFLLGAIGEAIIRIFNNYDD